MTLNKKEALTEVKQLMDKHNLTKGDVQAAFSVEKAEKTSSTLIKVIAFVAGLLVVAGFVFMAGHFWENMSIAVQLLLTLGTGFSTFFLALYLARDGKMDNNALVMAFLAIPIFLEPLGAGIAFYHAFDSFDAIHHVRLLTSVVLAAMALQYFIAGEYYKHLPMLTPISMLFMAGFLLFIMLTMDADYENYHRNWDDNTWKFFTVSALLLGSSLFVEKVRGYNAWMVIPYVFSLIGLVLSTMDIRFGELDTSSLITLLVSLITLGLGLRVNRRALTWPSAIIAAISLVMFVDDIIGDGVTSAFLMALTGMVTLYVLRRKSK